MPQILHSGETNANVNFMHLWCCFGKLTAILGSNHFDDGTDADDQAMVGLKQGTQCYEPVRRPWPRTPGTFAMPGAAAAKAQIIRGDKLEGTSMLASYQHASNILVENCSLLATL